MKDNELFMELANDIVYRVGCEVASEIDGDPYCFFCGSWLDTEHHAPICPFVKLVELVAAKDN